MKDVSVDNVVIHGYEISAHSDTALTVGTTATVLGQTFHVFLCVPDANGRYFVVFTAQEVPYGTPESEALMRKVWRFIPDRQQVSKANAP